MSLIIYDLKQLYRQTFGGNPSVPPVRATDDPGEFRIQGSNDKLTQIRGSALTADYLGKEIWLPVKFFGLDPDKFGMGNLLLPYTVIEMQAKKNIIKTPLADRKGTVKELYSIDDFVVSLKGFVIDETNRIWPEKELLILNELWKLNEAVKLDNALSNIFFNGPAWFSIEDLKLPAMEGRKHIRAFSMRLVSDAVFTLDQ